MQDKLKIIYVVPTPDGGALLYPPPETEAEKDKDDGEKNTTADATADQSPSG